jgi:HPt (histidine-containing phosphotransfer) domain-containing protein
MFALTVLGIFILIIAIVIYIEYKNEKNYQENRRKRKEERKKTKPPYDPNEKIQKPLREKKEKAAKRKASTPGAKEKSLPKVKKEEKKTLDDTYELKDTHVKISAEQEEAKKVPEEKTYHLPKCKYPKFDYSRLLDMGLGEDEAIEFVKELIPQIKTQIPLIQEAMDKEDFHNMERLTHSIKGSSTTVGTGGISDLLVEFNTYLKTGKDLPIAEAYVKYLNQYTEDLEKEFT